MEAICVNKKCVNFNRGIVYPLGIGSFDLIAILKGYPCNICPYRDLNIKISSVTKQIKFKQCMFTVKGMINKKRVI